MRLASSLRSTLPALLALVLVAPVRGETIHLVGADDRGVTLRLDVGPFELVPGADGRLELKGTGLPLLDEPGRPRLPYGYALIAVPPGARVVASVTGGTAEEARGGVRLALGERPTFHDYRDGFGPVPMREPVPPVLDGPWPASPVEVSEPFTVRRQTMVAIQIRPFRYDEAGGQLQARRSITVRLDFSGGGAAPSGLAPTADRHWEPVLKGAVLNYEQGRRWRAAPARPGAAGGSLFGPRAGTAAVAAFDESETEVRVRIDSTGVFALEYAKLAAAGFPVGIPTAELSVHRHEFTGYGSPPYATIELPIEVQESNAGVKGTFDAGDRILVWVQNWAERSRASAAQRAWGDGEVVYVTRLRSRAPLRIALRSGQPAGGAPVPPSYPWSQHIERNLFYFTVPPDTNMDLFLWTGLTDYYTRPDSIRFDINHLDASHDVDFAVQLQGRKSTTHFSWIQVKNAGGQLTTVADSTFYWSGRVLQNFAKTLPATAFSEGGNNRLVLWGKDLDQQPDPVTNSVLTAGLSGFDITYWRGYRALAGYLSCNNADAVGDYEIQAAGFATDSIRVYDVTDSVNVVKLTDVALGGGAVHFQDNSAGPRRSYVAFSSPKLLLQNKYSLVTPHQLYARGSGDYLLIHPEAFGAAAGALATLRENEGLDVVVAPLEAINDEFNGGRKSAYAIRRFIRYGYDNWQSRFVMLMGDGSEDPLNAGGQAGPDWIPVQKVFSPVGFFNIEGFFKEAAASDTWYVWAVDTPPAPAAPLLPDLYIGRLPVNSLAEANAVVSKLAAYEQVDTTQTWRRRILLHADDAFSGSCLFGNCVGGNGYCFRSEELKFLSLSQAVQAVIADSSGLALCEPEVFDMNDYLKNEPAPGGCRPDLQRTIDDTRAWAPGSPRFELFRRLNDGRLWWNFQGHANAQLLEHEQIYWKGTFPSDLDAFTNVGKPFLFTAFSCHANEFAQVREKNGAIGPAIGEEMVTLPGKGAIASWASVGYEIIPSSDTDHLNVTLAKSLFSNPPRDDYLGHGSSAVLGEAIAQTLLVNYGARLGNPSERDVAVTYTLLGDPATRLTVGPPQIIVTANHVPVTNGIPVVLPGVSDTLLLEADLVSNASIDSIALETTDVSGRRLVPSTDYTLTPPFPDTGPGQGGGRRFHLAYFTNLAGGTSGYTLVTRDRYKTVMRFEVVFKMQAVLRSAGRPIADDDAVTPDAALSLALHSPNSLDPATDITLTVDNVGQLFTATPPTPAREFILSWTHPPYAVGSHVARLTAKGQIVGDYRFQVPNSVKLARLVSFPNPFDDENGTRFTFDLESASPADLMIRVYTVSGRMIYERTERGLLPGHHELAWDGRDDEGDKLANGVYLYRMVAKGASGSASESGRLVKLRKPRRVVDTSTP